MINPTGKKYFFLAIFFIFTLACGISFNQTDDETEMLKLKITQQSLTMTQSAISENKVNNEGNNQEENNAQDGESKKEGVIKEDLEPEEPEISCNKAKFIAETIDDDAEFNPGETFTQTWTVRNDGSCTWDENYRVVFNEGDRMNGESTYYLNEKVEPGDTIKLSVHLTAPANPGKYKGYWNIKSPDKELFTFFWAQIKVVENNISTIFYKNNGVEDLDLFYIKDIGGGQGTWVGPGEVEEYNNIFGNGVFPPGNYTIVYSWMSTGEIKKQVDIHTEGQIIVLTP